jgi:hypothetical protein
MCKPLRRLTSDIDEPSLFVNREALGEMSKIILYPRAAPNDRVRVWLGMFQVTAAPALQWSLDGTPAQPAPLRDLTSVRPDHMLPAGQLPANIPRAFTGVYEFTGLQSNKPYTVSVEAVQDRASLEVKTLPDVVTAQLDRTFNVLLVSCFHQAEDPGGLAGIIVSQLKATSKPHLTILAGDQVYLDLPTLKNFPDDLPRLADKFERDYTLNWSEPRAYERVLAAAPSVSIADDHEYWNNFPHPSPVIQNSFTQGGRDRWKEAARAVYEGFQLMPPAVPGDPQVLSVHPLSFFFADTRSNRDPDRRFAMNAAAHQQLNDWVTDVINQRRFGVFVSGQSLFSQPAGNLTGSVGDFELPNYGDYGQIMTSLQRLVDAGLPVVCLTGDVHWGRVAVATDIRSGRRAFSEIISSPASLVTTVGVDEVKKAGNFISGLFGGGNPWPRHSNPGEPPGFLASDILQGRFPCKTLLSQRGNQVVLLKFRQHGSGLEMRVTYWPISQDKTIGKPVESEPINLTGA